MTTVRSEVARRDEERSSAPAQVTPQQAVKQQLDVYRPVIGKLLAGTGITEETFVAQIANACRATPALWQCEPATILGAALRAAQLGLAPNDVRNLCWIIPYKNQAQFQIGYGGVLELARRAVPGLKFDGRAVHPNDEFDVDFGKAEPLKHRPAVVCGKDRGGDAYAWYVRAVYPDGDVQIHVLDREGVEHHRKFSKQPNGEMWSKSYDAAALKSVVLDMKRWLPSSAQLVAAFAADDRVIHVDDVDTIDAESEEEARLELVSSPPAADENGEVTTPAGAASCTRCGLSLAGAAVETVEGGYVHKGGCPTSSPPDEESAGGDERSSQDDGVTDEKEMVPAASPAASIEPVEVELERVPAGSAEPDVYRDVDIHQLIAKVFDDVKSRTPRGQKTKVIDRIRHTLIWGVTKGEKSSLNDLSAGEKHRLWQELSWIDSGFNVAEVRDDGLAIARQDRSESVLIPWVEASAAA